MASAAVHRPFLDRAPNENTSNLYSEPSSGTAGFFQTRPVVHNQFHDDLALRRVLDAKGSIACIPVGNLLHTLVHLPPHIHAAVNPDLAAFGDKVLSKKVLN